MLTSLRSALLTAGLLATVVASASAQSAQPFRALFIGNSYTYVNDLPAVIGDLASAAKQPRVFQAYVVLVGGSTLEAHLARHVALDEIAKGKWDAVVLQEQSTRPITAPQLTLRDVRAFADAANKVGAKLVLYETWARENAPDTQDSLTHVYHAAAAAVGARVAHVAEAWRSFRAQEGAVPAGAHSALFRADGSHPTPVGTYLAASVMYATFYGASPVGLPGRTRNTMEQPDPGPTPDAPRESIDGALAKRIQNLAWAAVRPNE